MITLPLTPLVSSYGVVVPQLSCRGLGHTGGTLDKLEAIPGFQVDLSEAQIRSQLLQPGGVICAATAQLTDRKSTRLNSSHVSISYAVFCLKKKKQQNNERYMTSKEEKHMRHI